MLTFRDLLQEREVRFGAKAEKKTMCFSQRENIKVVKRELKVSTFN